MQKNVLFACCSLCILKYDLFLNLYQRLYVSRRFNMHSVLVLKILYLLEVISYVIFLFIFITYIRAFMFLNV